MRLFQNIIRHVTIVSSIFLLSIAAGSGYWRENAPKLKRIVFYFWFVRSTRARCGAMNARLCASPS